MRAIAFSALDACSMQHDGGDGVEQEAAAMVMTRAGDW